MHPGSAPGRPRPVGDPAVGALAARPEELARAWLVALLESRPLHEAATVPVADLAAAGPALCRDVLGAVTSDAALDELVDPARAPALARLAGTGGSPAVVAAAEALRRSLFAAAAAEVPHADAGALAGLGDRLAHVCARLAAGAIAAAASADRVSAESAASAAPAPARSAASADPAPARSAASADPAFAGGAPATEPQPAPARAAPADREPEAEGDGEGALLRALGSASGADPARAAGAAPLWRAALERRLADGGRFALLLVEVDGADRLQAAEGEAAARDLFARAGRAVRGAVRRGDLLAHEHDGRMWVIAPDAGPSGTAALAARVAAAVEASASSRGAPLTASVGIALYPSDARDADALTGHAEEAALAARAAGVRAAGAAPAAGPHASGPRLVR